MSTPPASLSWGSIILAALFIGALVVVVIVVSRTFASRCTDSQNWDPVLNRCVDPCADPSQKYVNGVGCVSKCTGTQQYCANSDSCYNPLVEQCLSSGVCPTAKMCPPLGVGPLDQATCCGSGSCGLVCPTGTTGPDCRYECTTCQGDVCADGTCCAEGGCYAGHCCIEGPGQYRCKDAWGNPVCCNRPCCNGVCCDPSMTCAGTGPDAKCEVLCGSEVCDPTKNQVCVRSFSGPTGTTFNWFTPGCTTEAEFAPLTYEPRNDSAQLGGFDVPQCLGNDGSPHSTYQPQFAPYYGYVKTYSCKTYGDPSRSGCPSPPAGVACGSPVPVIPNAADCASVLAQYDIANAFFFDGANPPEAPAEHPHLFDQMTDPNRVYCVGQFDCQSLLQPVIPCTTDADCAATPGKTCDHTVGLCYCPGTTPAPKSETSPYASYSAYAKLLD